MATRPDVEIIQSNGNLGRTAPSQDGITLLTVTAIAVVSKLVLGTVYGPYRSPEDAAENGIDAAYDAANNLLAYQHIKDFYDGAGKGTELYILPLAAATTMTVALDKTQTHIASALSQLKGKIRIVCVTHIPVGPVVAEDELTADHWTAITKAQELREFEFESPRHRPISVILEGHNFGGNASSAADLRALAANRVHVVISQDKDVAGSNAAYANYANAAYFAGVVAGKPVQRNAGRVKDGKLKVTNAGLSNNAAMDTFTETNLETLNASGYIFMLQHSGKDGYFFNDDHSCCPLSDDYAFLNHGRVMDKASRITRQVYLEELLDDVEVDPETGRLAVSTIKNYQGIVEKAINQQMTAKGEISGVEAFCDPNQDINATDLIETEVNIRKKGTSRYIKSTLAFSASTNA